jgi:Ca2+-binding RTX toxin-like protein
VDGGRDNVFRTGLQGGEDTVVYDYDDPYLKYVVVDLAQGIAREYGRVDSFSYTTTDTLVDIENATGSDKVEGDRISGDQKNNILRGLGGSDILYGKGGDDYLYGGTGDDSLDGDDGDDVLSGSLVQGGGNGTPHHATESLKTLYNKRYSHLKATSWKVAMPTARYANKIPDPHLC